MLERLGKSLDAIKNLKQVKRESVEFKEWLRDTKIALSHAFGEKSEQVKDFSSVLYSPLMFTTGTSDSVFQSAYIRGLDSATALLRSIINEVNEYWPDDENMQKANQSATLLTQTHDVFIIHGRDDGAKETVARFIAILGLNPIILHEQPNQGRTIIEKFERHAQVGFAIALLTPDDVGTLQGRESDLNPRARQNVIFEFGYFVGYLGRHRVCALKKNNVETPSDYDGVVYLPFDDSGTWKMNLVKELKAAGFDVDANRAL